MYKFLCLVLLCMFIYILVYMCFFYFFFFIVFIFFYSFFFSSRRRHTRSLRDWSSDVCSSDLVAPLRAAVAVPGAQVVGGFLGRVDVRMPVQDHDGVRSCVSPGAMVALTTRANQTR